MLDLTCFRTAVRVGSNASGEHADIVISTRIRLARNLEGIRVHAEGTRRGAAADPSQGARGRSRACDPIEDGVLVRVDELRRRTGYSFTSGIW